MNVSTGLRRIGTVVKVLAGLWAGLALFGFLFGEGDWFKLIVFGAGGAAVLWTVAWIIDGFAQR